MAPADKLAAREQLARLLPQLDFAGQERLLRINSPADSDLWRQDLEALIDRVDGLVVPKVSTAAQLQAVYEALDCSVPDPAAKVVFAIIESAQALLNLDAILAAVPRLTGVMLGGEDMAVDMNMPLTADPYYLDFARFRLVMLARAYQLQAIDGVETNLTLSEPELESAAQHARRFGFDGKLAIHPKQIAPLQAALSPTSSEVDYAQRLMAAYSQNQGAFQFEGRMIDAPIIQRAAAVLEHVRRLEGRPD